MTASSKIVLLVVAMLVTVTGLYYGFMVGGSDPLPIEQADGRSGEGADEGTGNARDADDPADRASDDEEQGYSLNASRRGESRPALGSRSSDERSEGTSTSRPRSERPSLGGDRPSLGSRADGPGGPSDGAKGTVPAPPTERASLGSPAADRSTRPALGDPGRGTARPALGGAGATGGAADASDAAGSSGRPALGDPPSTDTSRGAAAGGGGGTDDGGAATDPSTIPSPFSASRTERTTLGSPGTTARGGDGDGDGDGDANGTPARDDAAAAAGTDARDRTAAPTRRTTAAPLGRPEPPAEWTVGAGDTMSGIAQAWFGAAKHWKLIADANPDIDPARLRIGQRLVLPAKRVARELDDAAAARKRAAEAAVERERKEAERLAKAKADAARFPEPTLRPGDRRHVVGEGETLSSISLRYFDTSAAWQRIHDANRAVLGDDPNRLKVGMILRVPAKASD